MGIGVSPKLHPTPHPPPTPHPTPPLKVTYQTSHGQLLDLTTAPPAGAIDLSRFTKDAYLRIVTYKTARWATGWMGEEHRVAGWPGGDAGQRSGRRGRLPPYRTSR